jgi:thioredoxin reductase
VGAGVSGMAAAIEAKRRGLSFRVVEAARPFATLIDFPGQADLRLSAGDGPGRSSPGAREGEGALVEELERQVAAAGIEVTGARAERVGRSGDHLLVILAEGEPLRTRSVRWSPSAGAAASAGSAFRART